MTNDQKSTFMRIEPGSVVYKGDEAYVITSLLDTESVLAKQPDRTASVRLLISDIKPVPVSNLENVKNHQTVDVISDKDWRVAQKRFGIIQPLLTIPKFHRKRSDIEIIAKENGIAVSTVYRWLDLYESSGLVTSLMSGERSDKGKSRISSEVEQIIDSCIQDEYLTVQKKKPKKVCDEVIRRCKAQGIKPPHPNTVRNRIAAIPEKLKISRREGKKIASEYFSPNRGAFPDADWPLSVVQMDHTQLDIILVDDIYRQPIGRPWITLAMDVYSRMVAGFYISFEPPSALSAGLCLSHAMLPKDKWLAERDIGTSWPVWGRIDRLHLDNAKEFRGKMLERACLEYGTHIEWRPVKRPNYGGHVERLLGTFAIKIHELPGTTFSKPEERKEYNSDKKSAMTLREFETWLTLYITDVYHQSVHKGIGKSPLMKYEEGILGSDEIAGRGLPTKIVDEEKLKLDFMPLVERSVQRYGVVIDEIHYFHDVLTPWINAKDTKTGNSRRQFIFKRDPRDISVIYFFDPVIKEYFPIPYRDTSRPSISLWELKATRNFLKQNGKEEVDEEIIFEAYERMREIEEKAVKETRKNRRNKQRKKMSEGIHSSENNKRAEKKESTIFENLDIEPFEELEEI